MGVGVGGGGGNPTPESFLGLAEGVSVELTGCPERAGTDWCA